MIVVHLKLDTGLRRLSGGAGGQIKLPLDEGCTVLDVLAYLRAEPGEVGLMILNGAKVDAAAKLGNGDRLELYPFIEGG